MSDYETFLKSKHPDVTLTGFEVAPDEINPKAFLFQSACIRWALRLGKAALFEERGLGKTFQQGEWARLVAKHTGGKVIVVAPYGVAVTQTVPEFAKWGIRAKYCEDPGEMEDYTIIVTNYERIHKFTLTDFVGVVLDESSILKMYTGKRKQQLVEGFKNTPYKLACTATPAPNDYLELGNHAEFLDVMPSNEMISRWFINDSLKAGNYRLKKHAEASFWEWITSWAVCISKPADLGDEYNMPGYDLPALKIIEHHLPVNQAAIARAQADGKLMPDGHVSSTKHHEVKRESLADRLVKAREIVEGFGAEDFVTIWCDTNYEADELRTAFPQAVEVRGDSKTKRKDLLAFTNAETRMVITKPGLAGFGMNWQHCSKVVFFGATFSFERFYQAIGRSHRFGQTREVEAHVITTETEANVMQSMKDKKRQFEKMQAKMNTAMKKHGLFRDGSKLALQPASDQIACGEHWTLHLGDCVTQTSKMPDSSIDFSVYSPPFAGIYLYTDSVADMGNNKDMVEFLQHYEFLVKEKFRITKPGRLTAVHVKDLPLYKSSSDWFGIDDFSGLVSMLHRRHGWVFHSRITIWKDPVVEMEKTNSHGLLHKNFVNRAQVCRVGLPDYLMVFAKPDPSGMGSDVQQLRQIGDFVGTQPPAPHEYLSSLRQRKPDYYSGSLEEYNYSIAVWQRYASPVWFDIDQTRVLNVRFARANEDERHLCPLQLDVIERAIDLWTNRGETVLTPFAGIGSELVSAIKMGRKAVGVELKRSYFEWAVRYCQEAEIKAGQPKLPGFETEAELSAAAQ